LASLGILGTHANIEFWVAQNFARNLLTSRNHIWQFLPLDDCEATNPALQTAELNGHMP